MKTVVGNISTRLLIMLLVWGGGAVVEARQNKNDIAYWRRHYQVLRPADDARVSRAEMIFQRLIQVTGRRPDVEPKLLIIERDPWDLTLPIALPKGWIVLSRGVLDICYREPDLGDDRLAFVLAHELSHQLSGDLWHLRFFQAVDASSRGASVDPQLLEDVRRGVSMTEHVMARELQADEHGMMYAVMAGFDAQAIVTADERVNFFADWVRALNTGRVTGLPLHQLRPTPEERAATLRARLRQVVDQTAVFQVGLWWYYAGDYPRAILAFDLFREFYAGREVIHNLAASHHRLALQFYQAWKPGRPAIPFQVAMAVELVTRASRIYLDNRTQPSRGDQPGAKAAAAFQQHLKRAIDGYDKARQFDASYTPTALGLSSALILQSLHGRETDRQSDLAEAIATLHRALKRQPEEAPLHANLGVAYFYDGQLERAKAALNQALRLAPHDAAATYNLAYLARIEQGGDEARVPRPEKHLTDPLASQLPAGLPTVEERVQEWAIGDVLSEPMQARQRSRFRLNDRAYTFATYSTATATLTQDGEVLMAMALPGYVGRSAQGIAIGSRSPDLIAAYGTPYHRLSTTQGQSWSYAQQRIAFQLQNDRVVSWLIY